MAGNNWLAKWALAMNASTDFMACSGTFRAPDSMMMGASGLSRLISIASSCPFIPGMQ